MMTLAKALGRTLREYPDLTQIYRRYDTLRREKRSRDGERESRAHEKPRT